VLPAKAVASQYHSERAFGRCVRVDEVARRSARVALVWHGNLDTRPSETRNYARLGPVFSALSDVGVTPEPILYCDEMREAVRDQLCRVDGVLVWVDPISGDEDRSKLDETLREVASSGVWVSAHPDTILKMGTKEVLYVTRTLRWGTDTACYATAREFRERFPSSLGVGRPRVLKQNRGNGGIGVWKVARVGTDATEAAPRASDASIVRVQHAAPRDDATEELTLGEFMDRCEAYFAGSGMLIDQPFIERLREGMIRAYLVRNEVVGFARQQPAVPSGGNDVPAPDKVLGMPAAKTMYNASEPTFASLRDRLEHEWVPGLRDLVDLDETALPILWDADFLYGPRDRDGNDTYVLCEINVSSVLPFPPEAPDKLGRAVKERIVQA
jgi:hypothetical protein